jgi:hypothetical protein
MIGSDDVLRVYLVSVAVYAVVLIVETLLFARDIYMNGWLENYSVLNTPSWGNAFLTVIATSATPVYRIFIVWVLYYIATHTRAEFDELMNKEDK